MHKQRKGAALAIAALCCLCSVVLAEGEIEITPLEVVKGKTGELQTVSKVYVLSKNDEPSVIPTEGFTEDGIEYGFVELQHEDNSVEESKPHTEVVSIHTSSGDTETVMAKFKSEIQADTGDGFNGTLSIEPDTLKIEAAGYGTESYTVSETRSYPNLSAADTSQVPKTINKDGSVLNLTNIEWKMSDSEDIDGQDVAVKYTASATYSGKASRQYATGYTATAEYKGTLKRVTDDTVVYTAVFQETGKAEPTSAPETTETPEGEPEQEQEPAPGENPAENYLLTYWWVFAIGAAALLGGGGYGAYRIIRKRKKGY